VHLDRPVDHPLQDAAGATSPVGRALTMSPAGQVPPALRFAFASCQHYEHGWYTAYRHLVGDDPDLVAFLGDYVYEGAGLKQSIRMHPGGETITLADYRNRYALYKTDPDLQAAHAHCPWVATWDDHEVENNYAGAISQDRDPADAFLARRAAAYQAWYEHLPLRVSTRPRGPDARLYRSVGVGGLAKFFVLDTRQYRTDQPCGDRRKAPCPEMFAAKSTMLGAEQERWLLDGVARSEARWNVLAQQVFLSHEDAEPGPEEAYFMDSWNGYPGSRARLVDAIAQRGRGDTVVLTGDVHSSWVCDLHRDPRAPGSRPVAAEFVGTSITSEGDGADVFPDGPAILSENPHILFHNARRGYVTCTVTPTLWRADYRILPYVSQPDAPVSTLASFVVARGRPGIQRA
jgi:alkaline phosphatase D